MAMVDGVGEQVQVELIRRYGERAARNERIRENRRERSIKTSEMLGEERIWRGIGMGMPEREASEYDFRKHRTHLETLV